MRYLHILSAFAAEPWAMQPEKLEAIAGFLAFKAHGGDFSVEEVQARIDGRTAAAVSRAPGDIAVLPMMGVISQRVGLMQEISGGTSTDQLGADFREALADDTVKAIVFDIHSPGGSTFGVQELAAEIFAARGLKPVIAQVNSQCASAAYWLASQADEIVVTPSGEAGSIGVYTVHEDVTKALELAGVKATVVQGGVNKAELSSLKPLSDEAREALQARVSLTAATFNKAVAEGRGVDLGVVLDRFGQGRMFDAPDLVKRGMADRVGTLRETLARLGAPSTAARGTAGRNMRQAFAAGEPVKLALIEEHLREGGFPDALATAFVSRGKGALRQGDPGEEAKTAAGERLAAMRASLDGLSFPKL